MTQEAQNAQAYNQQVYAQQQAAQQQAYAQQQAAQQQAYAQQPYYAQPSYGEQYAYGAYPPPQPPAPQRTELSGGQKFGWFVIGFLMNIPGILLAWLTNGDSAQQVRSSAVKFAVIGFVIMIVLAVLTGVIIGGVFTIAITELLEEMDISYYSTALLL